MPSSTQAPSSGTRPSSTMKMISAFSTGLHVHEKALEYGVKVTGATVHFVNEIPDGGEIILQKAVEVKEGDTPEILQKRVMVEAEWNILPEAVSLFCQDRLTVENNIVHIGE